jgi:hypothetical protein
VDAHRPQRPRHRPRARRRGHRCTHRALSTTAGAPFPATTSDSGARRSRSSAATSPCARRPPDGTERTPRTPEDAAPGQRTVLVTPRAPRSGMPPPNTPRIAPAHARPRARNAHHDLRHPASCLASLSNQRPGDPHQQQPLGLMHHRIASSVSSHAIPAIASYRRLALHRARPCARHFPDWPNHTAGIVRELQPSRRGCARTCRASASAGLANTFFGERAVARDTQDKKVQGR